MTNASSRPFRFPFLPLLSRLLSLITEAITFTNSLHLFIPPRNCLNTEIAIFICLLYILYYWGKGKMQDAIVGGDLIEWVSGFGMNY